jgi:hypothetical protein
MTITILYKRIPIGMSIRGRERVLAHVLAHEIGHVLQCTNWHARSGVMKAHWTNLDYDAMERKPLEFTSIDVDLIRQGLKRLKSRASGIRSAVLPN